MSLRLRRDANPRRAECQSAGKMGGHRARPARREAHVVQHAPTFAAGIERLNVGGNRGYAGLRGSVHAAGGKIFDFSMQEEPEWATAVSLAQIEFEAVRFGKTLELRQLEIAKVMMCRN